MNNNINSTAIEATRRASCDCSLHSGLSNLLINLLLSARNNLLAIVNLGRSILAYYTREKATTADNIIDILPFPIIMGFLISVHYYKLAGGWIKKRDITKADSDFFIAEIWTVFSCNTSVTIYFPLLIYTKTFTSHPIAFFSTLGGLLLALENKSVIYKYFPQKNDRVRPVRDEKWWEWWEEEIKREKEEEKEEESARRMFKKRSKRSDMTPMEKDRPLWTVHEEVHRDREYGYEL
ncbi:hypothetical protein CI109_103197 [Kwoniella shandongensis]|uniref:Uncharacterized protein n=1 Tax=Kwoniella shandongensis TaxID=1734106 RepID=A0AAJ8MWX9_9TREE